jgi:hypothetical protein
MCEFHTSVEWFKRCLLLNYPKTTLYIELTENIKKYSENKSVSKPVILNFCQIWTDFGDGHFAKFFLFVWQLSHSALSAFLYCFTVIAIKVKKNWQTL